MLYEELQGLEKTSLTQHLKECPECAEDLAYTREVFNLMDEVDITSLPEADWNKCWGGIQQNIKQPVPARKSFGIFPCWVPAAIGILIIFAFGIFIGRTLNPSKTTVAADAAFSAEVTQASLAEHFDNLKPLLIEYSNFDIQTNTIQIDKNILQGLLIQNYLLKETVLKDNPKAIQILEDIDLVLREITNLENGESVSSALIKELIDQRDILFKMEILHKL